MSDRELRGYLRRRLVRGDWLLEMDRGGVMGTICSRPGFVTLLGELLGFAETETGLPYPVANSVLRAYRAEDLDPRGLKWFLFSIRRITRRMNQTIRLLGRWLPDSWLPARTVRVLGIIRVNTRTGEDRSERGSLSFRKADSMDAIGPDDHVLLAATHSPTLSEARIALEEAVSGRNQGANVRDDEFGERTNVTSPIVFTQEDDAQGTVQFLSDAPRSNAGTVILDNDSRCSKYTNQQVLLIMTEKWIREQANRDDVLAAIHLFRGYPRDVFQPEWRIQWRLVSRLRDCRDWRQQHDLLAEVARFLVKNSKRIRPGDPAPEILRGVRVRAVALDHLAYLLLAHHVLSGPASRLFHRWLHHGDECIEIREWKGRALRFQDGARAVSEVGCLLGVRHGGPGGPVHGPWSPHRLGFIEETMVRAGDWLYIAKWG